MTQWNVYQDKRTRKAKRKTNEIKSEVKFNGTICGEFLNGNETETQFQFTQT